MPLSILTSSKVNIGLECELDFFRYDVAVMARNIPWLRVLIAQLMLPEPLRKTAKSSIAWVSRQRNLVEYKNYDLLAPKATLFWRFFVGVCASGRVVEDVGDCRRRLLMPRMARNNIIFPPRKKDIPR